MVTPVISALPIIETLRPAGYTVRPRATEPNQKTGRERAGEAAEGDGVNTARKCAHSGKVTKQPNFHQRLSHRLLDSHGYFRKLW